MLKHLYGGGRGKGVLVWRGRLRRAQCVWSTMPMVGSGNIPTPGKFTSRISKCRFSDVIFLNNHRVTMHYPCIVGVPLLPKLRCSEVTSDDFSDPAELTRCIIKCNLFIESFLGYNISLKGRFTFWWYIKIIGNTVWPKIPMQIHQFSS